MITVKLTPPDQRLNYLIYGGGRHIDAADHVKRQLDMAGLVAAGSAWVAPHTGGRSGISVNGTAFL